MNSTNLPVTIQAINEVATWSNTITIGKNGSTLGIALGDYKATNTYWIVVLNRQTLKVELNMTTKDNASVPTQLQAYLGNTNYILLLSTQNLGSAYLPQGALYNLLVSEGAGVQLKRLEQIYETLNCGTWGFMAYSFAAVLGNDGDIALEAATIMDNAVLHTFELHPVDIGGNTFYTPVSL